MRTSSVRPALTWLLLATLAACTPSNPPPPVVLEFSVDTTIAPPVGDLPGLEDGQPRPVALIQVEGGEAAMFVADELWLQTDDESALQAFLGRWNGTVLRSFIPSDHDIEGMPAQYLVRIEANDAQVDDLASHLRTLDPRAGGAFAVSSEAGLQLIAAGSQEAADGMAVGINWVGQGVDFRNRSLSEAPTGDAVAGVAYSANPFLWPSHSSGGSSVQDIGVAEAWRVLDLAGRLSNKVRIAVIDMGFQPNADTPPGWVAVSNVPFVDPIGSENPFDCSSGNPCPWHGINVVHAAMAVADNGFGAAGPAGPVGVPVMIHATGDMFTSILSLSEARIAGARIANMSYGIPVHWALAWSVLPFETATAAFRATGMLIFAAAGNKGENVDAEGCTLGVCWERTWYTPCENAGVICVGGVRANSTSRDANSNWGLEQVDIFGPFTLLLGPDPVNTTNRARIGHGTSYAAPFVAGVAALIWAADPSLSANQVESILMSTAHQGGDASVGRYVNALGAVKAVVGNLPPSFELAPSMSTQLNLSTYLSVSVVDDDDPFPCCNVNWSSNVDGPLGSSWQVEHVFTTLGPRTVTVTAIDSGGASYTRQTVLTVLNSAPEAVISAPLSGAELFRTSPVVLRAQASDINEPDGMLACDRLEWTSSVLSDPFPQTGCQMQVVFESNGPRTLTVTATDQQGASGAASVQVTVVDPPPNLPPVVMITSPGHHQPHVLSQPMTLNGSAIDPEAEGDLSYRWTVQFFSEPEIEVGTTTTASWTPTDRYPFDQEGTYTVQVRLYVTDQGGAVGVDQVELQWVLIF